MAPNAGDSARKGQNMNTGFKHVYGPVPSRRLGRSLGVDALTFKSCSFDCVYCQLGRTTNHTIERKEYIPTADILDEVRRKLENGDKPEYISFAGSGEPTLHSGLGDIIRGIKAMTDVPVVVFTNGSLLWMPEVRADLAAADDHNILTHRPLSRRYRTSTTPVPCPPVRRTAPPCWGW